MTNSKETFGIIAENGTLIKFASTGALVGNPLGMAKCVLAHRLKTDGFELNKKGINDLLDSWIEWFLEVENRNPKMAEVIDQAVDNMCHSNLILVNVTKSESLSVNERCDVAEQMRQYLSERVEA